MKNKTFQPEAGTADDEDDYARQVLGLGVLLVLVPLSESRTERR